MKMYPIFLLPTSGGECYLNPMNEKASYKDGKIYIPVFSFTDGTGEAFFQTLGVDPNGIGEIAIGDKTAQVELFRIIENSADGLQTIVDKADAAILLIRFLDQLSITRIREVFRILNVESFLPKTVLIQREANETEFKISCTYCGQKLWVRDRDSGRRGNCPQCRKTFFIPTQKSFVTSFLMLTDTVPVQTVTNGDASCRNAVASLVERIVSMEDGMKSSTMRIELPTDEK
ncbi:MAG TPA: hypothetical protein PJ991_07305 [Kiritimatiellia bacterium]|nr:hypothetical protein [Kiritimatiellia bacterium]